MVKSWLPYIFTIDSRVGQLEDHGLNHWAVLPQTFSLGISSKIKPFKQLGVAKSTLTRFSVENWRAEEPQKDALTCKWTVCSEAHQEDEKAACQLGGGNGQGWSQPNKKCQKVWSSPGCVWRVLNSEGLKYYKRVKS